MKREKFGKAPALVALMLVMAGIMAAMPVMAEENGTNGLQELYRKYGITENDIKFAKGELPYYLEGTPLDGKVASMGKVIPDGNKAKAENWFDPLFYTQCVLEGYKVLSASEWFEAEQKAINRYIAKYGVDPRNSKVEIVDGIPLPKEYVNELIKNGGISFDNNANEELTESTVLAASGPWAKSGKLYVWIFEAKDSYHKPTEAYLTDTINALGRFYQFGPTGIYYYHKTGIWDASDVSPPNYYWGLINDLNEDTNFYRSGYNDYDPVNDIVLGWVKNMDHNGAADINGWFSVCATVADDGVDWPHDSIVQHEVSHNFNAPEGGTWWYEHPECIMNYWYAYWGTDIWCNTCWNKVYGNIRGFWE